MASTIGHVMEEAGDRVDSNIDELKREYTEKLGKMQVLLKKVSPLLCIFGSTLEVYMLNKFYSLVRRRLFQMTLQAKIMN